MEWTISNIARLFGTTEQAVGRLVAEAGLPVHVVNDQHRFHRAEVLEWATSHGQDVAPEALGELGGASPQRGLADALRRGGLHDDVPGSDRDAVLRAVVERLPLPAGTDARFIADVLCAWEGRGSSAVGDGIAIPHIRNPLVLRVREPIVALSRLAQPVDFGARDGLPVRILFTLVSPTVRAHLHVLALLAHALRDPGVRSLLSGAAGLDELAGALERLERGEPA